MTIDHRVFLSVSFNQKCERQKEALASSFPTIRHPQNKASSAASPGHQNKMCLPTHTCKLLAKKRGESGVQFLVLTSLSAPWSSVGELMNLKISLLPSILQRLELKDCFYFFPSFDLGWSGLIFLIPHFITKDTTTMNVNSWEMEFLSDLHFHSCIPGALIRTGTSRE